MRALHKVRTEVYLPSDHISTFVDVGDSVEKTFDTGESLPEVTFWVVPVVEIFSHIYYFIYN